MSAAATAMAMGFKDGVLLDGVLSQFKTVAAEQITTLDAAFASDCLWLEQALAATLDEIQHGKSPVDSPALGDKPQGLVCPPTAAKRRSAAEKRGRAARKRKSSTPNNRSSQRTSSVAKTAKEKYGGLLAYGDEEEPPAAKTTAEQPQRKKRSLDASTGCERAAGPSPKACVIPQASVDQTLNLTGNECEQLQQDSKTMPPIEFDSDLSSIHAGSDDDEDFSKPEEKPVKPEAMVIDKTGQDHTLQESTGQEGIVQEKIERQGSVDNKETLEQVEDVVKSLPTPPAIPVISKPVTRDVRRSASCNEMRPSLAAKTPKRGSTSFNVDPRQPSPMVDAQGKVPIHKILESQKRNKATKTPGNIQANASSMVAKLTGRKFKLFKNGGSIYGDKTKKPTNETYETECRASVDLPRANARSSLDFHSERRGASVDIINRNKSSKLRKRAKSPLPFRKLSQRGRQPNIVTCNPSPECFVLQEIHNGNLEQQPKDGPIDPLNSATADGSQAIGLQETTRKLHELRNKIVQLKEEPTNSSARYPKIEVQSEKARPRPDSTAFRTPAAKVPVVDPAVAVVSILPPKVATESCKANGEPLSQARVQPRPYTPCPEDSALDSSVSLDGRPSREVTCPAIPSPLATGKTTEAKAGPSNLVTSSEMASMFVIPSRLDVSKQPVEPRSDAEKEAAMDLAAHERIRAVERQRRAAAKAKQDELEAKRQKYLEKKRFLEEENERRRADLIRKEKEREGRVKQALQRDRLQKEQKRKEQEQRYIERANRLNEMREAHAASGTGASRPVVSTNKQLATPGAPPGANGTTKDAESYDMTSEKVRMMYDECDSDDDKRRRRKKQIPGWANGNGLIESLKSQEGTDPDRLFKGAGGSEDGTMNLSLVFQEAPQKPRYRKRTSSANWTADRLTGMEELEYKKNIGLL